jgi:hypothetical protein
MITRKLEEVHSRELKVERTSTSGRDFRNFCLADTLAGVKPALHTRATTESSEAFFRGLKPTGGR